MESCLTRVVGYPVAEANLLVAPAQRGHDPPSHLIGVAAVVDDLQTGVRLILSSTTLDSIKYDLIIRKY